MRYAPAMLKERNMPRATVVIRELNRDKPDFSLDFDLPEVPKVGDYISIFRPDFSLRSQDVIVRHVWWHLSSPEEGSHSDGQPRVGWVQDIMIECDVALGPYASEDWRRWAAAAKTRGAEVVVFKVTRSILSTESY
jgi:hypothetical protein